MDRDVETRRRGGFNTPASRARWPNCKTLLGLVLIPRSLSGYRAANAVLAVYLSPLRADCLFASSGVVT